MFKNKERNEVFSFRKYKGFGLAGAVIGAFLLSGTSVAYANVIDNGNGATTLENGKTSITLDSNKVKVSDKTATELYNEGSYAPDTVTEGSDKVTLKEDTKIKYTLEDGKEIDDTVTVSKDTVIDENYSISGKSGKVYKGEDTVNVTVDQTVGKKDAVSKEGKTYEYVRSEVEKTGTVSAKESVTLNDVSVNATVQGMHKADGSINYEKAKGRVWLVEEKEDGTYGKFKLIENGSGLNDDKISELAKDMTGVLSKSEVDKLGGIKDGDTIMVYETNTYAAVKKESTVINNQFMSWGYSDSNQYFPQVNEKVNDWLDSLVFPNFEKIGNRYFYKGDEVFTSPKNSDSETNKGVFVKSRFYELVGDYISSGKDASELTKIWLGDDGALTNPLFDSYVFSLIERQNREDFNSNDIQKSNEKRNLGSGLITDFEGRPMTDRTVNTNLGDKINDVNSFYKTLESAYSKENLRKLLNLYKWRISELSSDSLNGYMTPSEVDNLKENELTLDMWRDLVGYKYSNGVYSSMNYEERTRFYSGESGYVEGWGYFLEDDGNYGRILLDTSEGSGNERFYEFLDDVSNYRTLMSDSNSGILLTSDGSYDDSLSSRMKAKYGSDKFEKWSKIASYGWLRMYYKPYKPLVENRETFTYHDQITPLRAYRVGAENTVLRHIYAEVKKAPLNVNYYLENTTTSLAPSENQAELPVKSDYTTQAKTIEPKKEVQDLPEKTVTTVTTYELVGTPDNANGKIADGGTTVNYFYRAVEKVTEVAKQAPVTVNYYKEGTTEKLADTIEQGQKDIGSNYTTEAKSIPDKVEVQDLEDRVITKTTSYELVSEPTDKEGKVPVGGKVVNYFYREVVKEDVVMKQAPVTVNYYKEGTTEKLADTIEQGQKDIGSNYTTEAKSIPDKVEVQDLEDRVITKTTSYELVSEPTDKEGKVPVGGKVVNYFYREVVKEDVVMKQAPVTVNYYKEGTTEKLADTIEQGQKDIGSNYTTEAKSIPDKVEVQDLEDRVITKTTSYELVAEPTDKEGKVPVGGKVVNYFYREVVKEDVVMKQAPVTVNYYKEGTTEKLADTIEQGQKDIGSAYTTETKTIEPKVEVQDLEDRTVTRTTTYELVSEPTDKNGTVPVGGKTVNYFYRPVVKEDVVMKQAPVVANYYLEGTETKLAPSDEQGQKDIGSAYTTETKTIEPKVEVQDLEDRTVTRTTTYELVSEPTDKEGKVPVGGKVVNYYYREVVKEDVVMKQAPVTVNYYKEGTTEKLADTIEQGQKDIGSNYTTEAKSIPDKVETKEFDDKTVTTTTIYELVKVPEDKDGIVPVDGKVVNYYYREVVKEDVVKKQAPVTINYYKEGTKTKLADSIEQGQKDIGSKYTSEAKVIEPKVETKEVDGNIVTTTTSYELVKVPEDKDGIVPVGGKVVNYYYREVVNAVGKPNDAPKVDIPEYKEPIGIPGEPEVHEKPEFNGGVVPLDPPTVEIPELKIPEEPKPQPEPTPEPQPVPTPQPTPTPQPEPSPAPNPVPVTPETPERPIAPVTPEQPAEPATPQYMDGQRELPNTGTEANSSLAALGLLGVLSGFGLIARKKRKDEE